jgi:hypothetical protein
MRKFRPTDRTEANLAWIALGVLLLTSFCIDFGNEEQGGAIDLRNRVTGARLLLDHIDPYFYKWQEPEPAEYCDPYNNPKLPVSKTTATPALLLLGIPVAVLPYRLGQFAWLFLQWGLLLGAAWRWFRILDQEWKRLLLGVFVAGFTYTAAWRLHAERGQSYVLLLFLFAVWLAGTLRTPGGRPFILGLLAGWLAALRPPFLLLGPVLLLQRRGQLPGMAAGLLLGIVLPMLWRGDIWMKYGAAMQTHSALYRQGIDPAPGPERFPATIEGMSTDVLGNYVTIPYADFSVHGLLGAMGLEPFPGWPPLMAAVVVGGAWLWWRRSETMEQRLIGVAVWLFVIDCFVPAYRNNYNDVLIINVVALALMGTRPWRATPWSVWLCCAALPVGWAIYVFAPMHDWMINLPSAKLDVAEFAASHPTEAEKADAEKRPSGRLGG